MTGPLRMQGNGETGIQNLGSAGSRCQIVDGDGEANAFDPQDTGLLDDIENELRDCAPKCEMRSGCEET